MSIPIDESNESVNRQLKQQISDGNITLGELIVPQKYTKLSLVGNQIVSEEITMEGRTIPLYDIRRSMLTNQQQYMRAHTDAEFEIMSRQEVITSLKSIHEYTETDDNVTTIELVTRLKRFERTRHLMTWHDCSTIGGHSHFLIMYSTMYDPAVFYTNKEYYDKFHQHVDVQATVEQPELYIFARCPSNDQQLLYSEIRINDINLATKEIEINGIQFKDIIRIFKGDNPAAQLEAGQQKGGNYFCVACKINAFKSKSIFHSQGLEHLSLQDRINKITCSHYTISRIKHNNTKYFENLEHYQVVEELRERKINFRCDQSTSHLRELLKEEIHGIQRLPALMFSESSKTLSELNLERYEILSNEPLHDISNHTKNLYAEIPYHFKNKKEIETILNISFKNKAARNSSDYRESLLFVTKWLLETHPNHYITDILTSMSEIQELLYQSDNSRSSQTILRLYLTLFKHSILIHKHIENPLKSLTERKFFGAYYHSLFCHSPEQYRLISGRTANAEKEESTFNFLKTVTNLASNHHCDNVLINAIIRLQVRKQTKSSNASMTNQSFLHKIYTPIKEQLSNTFINFNWIRKYSSQYQRLLERIADYLIDDQVWWKEVDEGVQFLDLTTEKSKALHHFRSWTIKEDSTFIKECWEKCVSQKHSVIPAFKLKIKVGTDTVTHYLTTLSYFKEESMKQQNLDGTAIFIASEVHQETSHSPVKQSINITDENINSVPYKYKQNSLEQSGDHDDGTAIFIATEVHQIESPSRNSQNLTKTEFGNNSDDGKAIFIATDQVHQKPTTSAGSSLSSISTSNNSVAPLNTTPLTDLESSNISLPIPREQNTESLKHGVINKASKYGPQSSTPIRKVYKHKKNEIIALLPSQAEEPLSSSSMHLTKIFGKITLISEFDAARKKLKGNKCSENLKIYQNILAKIEVKLCNRYDELRLKLKELDKRKFLKESFNQSDYDDVINSLKYIKVLSKELKLNLDLN